MRTCAVIPVYNHEQVIASVVEAILAQGLDCILVDDGSTAHCAQALDALSVQYPDNVTLLRHQRNRGKGAAVLTGLHYAYDNGYTHAIQIDADGQHRTEDIPRFIALAVLYPDDVINGCPEYDESVPKGRLYGRYITHVWVWIHTLSFAIKDSMCGFRLYPLQQVMALTRRCAISERMNFDTEILVRLYWDNVGIHHISTRVIYPDNGVSHFRMFKDNVLITRMHTILFFGMLWRLPLLLTRKIKRTWATV